jgi:NADH-quinone oxidoreductase subunit H
MQHVRIPQDRLGVLIGEGGETMREIEREAEVRLDIDSESGSVGVEAVGDPVTALNGPTIVKAIGRGFPPEAALTLLDDDMTMFDIVDIDAATRNDKDLRRKKGRLIGEDGRTRELMAELSGASVVIFAGSLRMSEIVAAQSGTLFSLGPISVPAWFAFVNPFAFALFFVANLAEVGRNPFDIPEAPTEIVAGYQTEYSSVYFVLFYLGEFIHIFLGGAIIATLFLGGPAGPVLPGIVWFTIKIWAVFFFTQWCRSAVPRVRIDQLIQIGWKGMLVLSFANLVLTAVIVGVIA